MIFLSRDQVQVNFSSSQISVRETEKTRTLNRVTFPFSGSEEDARRLALFRDALAVFKGNHAFHNYTRRKQYRAGEINGSRRRRRPKPAVGTGSEDEEGDEEGNEENIDAGPTDDSRADSGAHFVSSGFRANPILENSIFLHHFLCLKIL